MADTLGKNSSAFYTLHADTCGTSIKAQDFRFMVEACEFKDVNGVEVMPSQVLSARYFTDVIKAYFVASFH